MSTQRREQPLVVLVSSVPLLADALDEALEFAEVKLFDDRGDVSGLLRWLRPEAVVVDSDEAARAASEFAHTTPLPVLHIDLQRDELRVLSDGEWQAIPLGEGAPEIVRHALAAALFAGRTPA